MSRFRVALRMIGPSSRLEAFVPTISGLSLSYSYRSNRDIDLNVLQQNEAVLVIDLAKWSHPTTEDNLSTSSDQVDEINHLTETLIILTESMQNCDRSDMKKSLYISTIRKEDQGGFEIPAKLVSVCASFSLSIEVSILVLLDE